MDNFSHLSVEKQNILVDAALTAFGRNGYRKASVSDIASAAGISKAAIFYYFGSKKTMYIYLINLCIDIVYNEIETKFDSNVTDFFDKIRIAAEIKVAALKKHKAITSFIISFYNETDPEVESEIKEILHGNKKPIIQFALDKTDISKFKDGVDPELVTRFLTWASYGFASEMPKDVDINVIDSYMNDFSEILNTMKENFYK